MRLDLHMKPFTISMHLLAFSDDIIRLLLGRLRDRDLHRAMSTCRRLRTVGKTAHRWTVLRQQSNLPPPKLRARHLKTDYDVFMQKACRSCRFNLGSSYGFCHVCQQLNRRVAIQFYNYNCARKQAKKVSRRMKTLKAKLDACLHEQAEADRHVQTAHAVLSEL